MMKRNESASDGFKLQSIKLRSEIGQLHKQLSEHQLLEARLRETLHDLHVHQEELRTQNDDLVAAQQAIAEAHKKYLDLFDHAPIGYFLISEAGTIQEANLTAAKLLDRARSSIMGKPLWLYLEKPQRDKFSAHLRALDQGNPAFIETGFLQPTGKTVPVEFYSQPAQADGDRPESYRIAVLDATRWVRAETALHETNRWLDSILYAIPDIVYRLDHSGIIQYISPTVENFGYNPEALIGKHFLDLVYFEDRDKASRTFDEQKRGKQQIRDVEIRLDAEAQSEETSATDSLRVFSFNAIALCEDNGDRNHGFLGVQGIAHDITERKQREQEQHELKEQLQRAQRMEAIGNLAGGIAHDFNNIMTGIQGSVSLLQMLSTESEKSSELLAIIEKCVTRGRNLTEQLLGFAKGGKYVVTPLNMNETLSSCLQIFNPVQKNIEVFNNFSSELWSVEADAGQMDQVFLNLFINAEHAMPEGGTLHISTANTDIPEQETDRFGLQSGEYVVITVEDNGIGMDEETCNRIFEPFFSTKPGKSGTGMGLASAYGIITHHGGAINVKSAPGKGSTFTIMLPACPLKEPQPFTARETQIELGNGSILIVDDEEMVRDVTSQMLNLLGYTVKSADSGKDGLNLFKENPQSFDLVVLDILMPGMNGLETYSQLKKIREDIKVIFASGYSPDSQIENIVKTEKQFFLKKPFNLDELSKLLNQAFE